MNVFYKDVSVGKEQMRQDGCEGLMKSFITKE